MRVAFLQAGGKGTRIESFAKGLLPKQLLPCNKGAVIDYALEACLEAGCLPHIVLPRTDNSIADYVGRSGYTAVFSHSIGSQVDDTLMYGLLYEQCTVGYVMPDTMFEPPDILDRMMSSLEEKGGVAVIAVFETDEPQKFGMCKLKAQTVEQIVDKPEEWPQGSGMAWGLIVWKEPFWEAVQIATVDGCTTFSDVLNYAIKLFGSIPYVVLDGYVDIATAQDYRKVLENGW